MTKKEKAIILRALGSSVKRYREQEEILKEYMATNPNFPTTTQIYHRAQGEYLAMMRLCKELGFDGADFIGNLI
jgi:hypothetical protein